MSFDLELDVLEGYEHTFEDQIATLKPADIRMVDEKVTFQIDGETVTVPLVTMERDANRRPIKDDLGNNKYRYTTIHDAAVQHFGEAASQPIPIVCHQDHMKP